jgi:hypothetical protein
MANYTFIYEQFEQLREYIGDKELVNELQQYWSADDLHEFIQHCARMFDIEEMIEENKSSKFIKKNKVNEMVKPMEEDLEYKGLDIDVDDVHEWLPNPRGQNQFNDDQIQLAIDCLEDNGITKRQLKIRSPKAYSKKYAIYSEGQVTGDVWKKQIEIKRLIGKEKIEEYMPWETFKNILYGIIMSASKI